MYALSQYCEKLLVERLVILSWHKSKIKNAVSVIFVLAAPWRFCAQTYGAPYWTLLQTFDISAKLQFDMLIVI